MEPRVGRILTISGIVYVDFQDVSAIHVYKDKNPHREWDGILHLRGGGKMYLLEQGTQDALSMFLPGRLNDR